MNPDAMARGLGWFSIGLGVTELVAHNQLAKSLGMEGKESLIQLFGAREIAHGVGCLTQNPPTLPVWSRVAGDALDIAALLPHLTPDNPKRHNVGFALAAVVGVTVLDILTGTWLSEGRNGPITRMARRPLERIEQRNEQRMRATEQRGGQFASEIAARSSQGG